MTNKLIEVGNRYRTKASKPDILVIVDINSENVFYKYDLGDGDYSMTYSQPISEFWDYFEEIPTQTPVCKKSLQTDEVEKAKEMLRFQVRLYSEKDIEDLAPQLLQMPHRLLRRLSNELINALDSQKEEESKRVEFDTFKKEKEIDIKTESVDSKDIWKPVSELPEDDLHVLIKMIDGEVLLSEYQHYYTRTFELLNHSVKLKWNDDRIQSWCKLTDFVNQQQDLLSRVERIEKENK